MKYIIPQDKLQNIVFRYLDLQDLEKVKPKHFKGFLFKKPNDDSEYSVLGWNNDYNILYIYYKLIEEISSMFSLEDVDSKEIIGKWVEDRYKLRVVRARILEYDFPEMLKIDIN